MLKKIMTTLAIVATVVFTQTIAQAEEVHKFDQVDWKPAGIKGIDIAVLWGNEADSSAVYAFRFQPGVVIPAHIHSRDYWGIAVQGKWVHIDAKGKRVVTGQNAFVRVRGHDVHGDSCAGPKVCINIVDFDGARDLTFTESSKK